MGRILVIDDDVDLAGLLVEFLRPEAYEVDVVHEGEEGIRRLEQGSYSLVLLDVSLPRRSGYEVLLTIRERSTVPVIMISARSDTVDRVLGLRLGADDYLVKPFSERELVARVEAVLRRRNASEAAGPSATTNPNVISVDDVMMDVTARSVSRGGQAIELTTMEFDVLRVLLQKAGTVVSREDLHTEALGRRFSPFDRSVDNYVSSLRKKLGKTIDNDERLRTVRGVGYIYVKSTVGVQHSKC